MTPDDLDLVFHALAHRDRRHILDLVREAPGCRIEEVSRRFATSRIAVLKHIRVLEKADLIHSEKVGRERRLYFNAVPIQQIHERWANDFSALWASELIGVKRAVEAAAVRVLPSDASKRHA